MRLRKAQRTALLEWISEGFQTSEINECAAEFDPPFEVTPQLIDYYRKTRQVKIEAITAAGEATALTTGLARKEVRVQKLQALADRMEEDLMIGGRLWLEQRKAIGYGENQEIFDYEEFNGAEVAAYRGVLDDIAKEVGHRRQVTENQNWDMSQFTLPELDRLAAGETPEQVMKDRGR